MVNNSQFWAAVTGRLRNRRFWRDSGLLMLANVIGIGLGLIRTPAMAWLLPREEVGMLGVVAAWQVFLVFLTWPSGLGSATYHFVAKGQPTAFIVYLAQQLRSSLLSILGFLLSAAYWWWQGESTVAVLFVVGGLTYPMTVVLAACAGMLGAQEKFASLFWYRIGQNLSGFTGFVLLLLSIWWISRVVTFYTVNQIALALLHVGLTIWLVWQLRQAHVPPMSADQKQEMMRYGKHLTGIGGISLVQSHVDQFLVGTFLPLEVMADYSIALVVYEQLKRIWMVNLTVRYPTLVRLSIFRRRRRVVAEGSIVWLGFLVLGITLSLLSLWLIPIILPSSYINSVTYISWLVAVFVVGVPGFWAEVYFRTEQDERSLYQLRGTAAISSILLPIILINWLGVYGVMFGRLLSNMILSVQGIWLFWYKNPARIADG